MSRSRKQIVARSSAGTRKVQAAGEAGVRDGGKDENRCSPGIGTRTLNAGSGRFSASGSPPQKTATYIKGHEKDGCLYLFFKEAAPPNRPQTNK